MSDFSQRLEKEIKNTGKTLYYLSEASGMQLDYISKMSKGNTVYILDEPTTGLHFQDIKKLLEVLNRLLEKGNTVIIIEHNLDVIKTADHIIDIGVDGGENGGTVVATGTPEEIAKSKKSYTGKYIAKILKKKK